eukprot:Opistho-1_new@4728
MHHPRARLARNERAYLSMLRMLKLSAVAMLRRFATRWRLARARAPVKQFGRDLHVGSRTRMWAPETLRIGDHCYVGKEVHVETNCQLGRNVLIANRVAFVGRRDHDFRTLGVPVRFGHWIGSRISSSPYRSEGVVVEDDVWIGFGAILLSGVTIGRGAIVAAGSVVKANVPSYDIVAGNPAITVGRRFKNDADIAAHERMTTTG